MRCAIAALLLFVACATNPSATPTPTAVTLPPEAAAAVQAAIADAATHLGVGPDQLSVGQVQAQQWPDSSLGCPQPGQLYSQIVTPGYLVTISGSGKQLEYHTDTRSRVTLCRET